MARAVTLISSLEAQSPTRLMHRVVQWVQETKGEEAAMKVVGCE